MNPEEQEQSEEVKQQAEELKRRAYEEEIRRLEKEEEQRASELVQKELSDDAEVLQVKKREIDAQEKHSELTMKAAEDEVQRVLDLERQKRLEQRRREEAELKRREQEERRRDEEQKAQEELSRRRAEEDLSRRESEEKLKQEAEKKRSELESLRREQDKLRRENDRQERIKSLLKTAESFYASADYEHAAIEVAKALVNDPTHPDILALERKIKDAQGTTTPAIIEKKPVPQSKEIQKTIAEKKGQQQERPKIFRYITYGVFAALIVSSVFLFLHYKKQFFPTPIRIAVLPWSLASNSEEDNLITTGLASEITREFQELRQVLVLGSASISRALDARKNPDQVAEYLGSPYIIQSSFSRSGENFFTNIQLVDSAGKILWSQQYIRPSSFLAELPRDVFTDISKALNELTSEPLTVRPIISAPTSGEVYIHYLKGLAWYRSMSSENTERARVSFLHATELDSQFAAGYAYAAQAILRQLEHGWDTSVSSLRIAKRLAEQALVLDTSLGNAHCALGKVLTLQGEYDLAQMQLDRAFDQVPRSSDVLIAKAYQYFRTGLYNEVMDVLARAFEADPLNAEVLTSYALLHQLTGTSRQGMMYHEKLLQIISDSTSYLVGPIADAILSDPGLLLSYHSRVTAAFEQRLQADSTDARTLYNFARMMQVSGQAAEAASLFLKLELLLQAQLKNNAHDARFMILYAKTETRLGKFADASDWLNRALKVDPTNYETRYGIAQIYSLQMYSQKNRAIDEKKKNDALQALRQAISRSYRLDKLTDGDFYNLYELPEFRSVLREQSTF